MALGENIKRIRELRKMSVDDLADKMGIGRAGIYKWESNETKPGLDSLIDLSKALDVTIDELVNENHTSVDKASDIKKKELTTENQLLLLNSKTANDLIDYLLRQLKYYQDKFGNI